MVAGADAGLMGLAARLWLATREELRVGLGAWADGGLMRLAARLWLATREELRAGLGAGESGAVGRGRLGWGGDFPRNDGVFPLPSHAAGPPTAW